MDCSSVNQIESKGSKSETLKNQEDGVLAAALHEDAVDGRPKDEEGHAELAFVHPAYKTQFLRGGNLEGSDHSQT